MKWKKLGLIVTPGRFTWIMTHAQNPFAIKTDEETYKIYFAGRDKYNRARGGFAEININNPKEIISFNQKPILDLGEFGCFDDSGIMPSTLVKYNGNQYMYYTGWSQAVVTPFTFYIGLSISKDGGRTFRRYSKAPVLGRSITEPFLTCSPWVVIENGIWKMWYVSGTGWKIPSNNDPKLKHYYHIRYVESKDGLNWNPKNIICIDFRDDEYAIARPTVYKENNIYKMWYCYRGGYETYRAGYAESKDGLQWERKDGEAGIDVSETGWDSEMICYPYVFEHKDKKFMLYNGNSYGKSGIGLAILEKEE